GPAGVDMDGYVFRCRVGGECGKDVFSETTTILIKKGASVKTQRDSQVEICEGSATTIFIEADAASYQWQVDRGDGFVDLTEAEGFAGAGRRYFDLGLAGVDMDGFVFRCRVQGECGKDVFSETTTILIKK